MDLSVYTHATETNDRIPVSNENLDELVLTNAKNSSILSLLEKYLQTPRYEGDACIVLSMPDAVLKKYREKLNSALWWLYKRYCKKDFGMMELLVAVETMVDASKLTAMLDNDIKLLVAKEKGITISIDELEVAAKMAGSKKQQKEDAAPVEDAEPSIEMDPDPDKLLEDDPDEEAEILGGLGVMDEEE